MSKLYLPEHAQSVLVSLDLACKEAEHLRYSQSTLFALPIDLAWVQNLARQPALAEKVEAFGAALHIFRTTWAKNCSNYPALVGEPPQEAD